MFVSVSVWNLRRQMVEFAGYSLPVQYSDGVLQSHLHTRAADSASLFDVGHMGQIWWTGKDAAAFLETIVVGDMQALKPGEAKLSLVTNAAGGILDDTVISHIGHALCVFLFSPFLFRVCVGRC